LGQASRSTTQPSSDWNAIAEYAGRAYTTRTDQVQRSFGDTGLKQRGLEFVLDA
jgi:hypothetical protein